MEKEDIGVYIVKNEDNAVRYLAVGQKDSSERFYGLLFDYAGGGKYEEALVIADDILPDSFACGQSLSRSQQNALFDRVSPVCLANIHGRIAEFCAKAPGEDRYRVLENQIENFAREVLIDKANLITPYGIGNTTFFDGYEVFPYEGSFAEFLQEHNIEQKSASQTIEEILHRQKPTQDDEAVEALVRAEQDRENQKGLEYQC